MSKSYVAAAEYTKEPFVAIAMKPVESNQVKAVGYDPATKTLAVTFTRGAGAIYHYPNVEPKVHADFLAAESIGKFFGANVQGRAFLKFPPPAPVEGAQEAAAPAAATA